MNKNDKLLEKISEYVKKSVSISRFEHSLRTAQMCKKICLLYGIDEEKGYLAGLAHDMCKKMDDKSLIELAKKDEKLISEIELNKPALLHGRAAAVKIQSDFKITDPEIIQAIANHTFGSPGLCDLAKALYAADKIEPGREQVSKEYYQRLFSMTFDKMIYTVALESVQYLTKKGKEINSITMSFLEELKNKIK